MDLFANEYLAVSSIIMMAALTQSVTGFGVSIVAMSFFPGVIGLQTSVPFVTLVPNLWQLSSLDSPRI